MGTPGKKAKTVKTGDESSVMFYIFLAALAWTDDSAFALAE